MYKSQNRRQQTIKWMGICVCSICFLYGGANAETSKLFDDLLKTIEQSRPIDQIFNGKTSVENLYTKSLKMIKTKNMVILKDGIEELTQIISQQSNKQINKQDVMNILYDTSAATKKFASLMNGIKKRSDARIIPEANIDASYINLSRIVPSCTEKASGEKTTINSKEKACIKQRIKRQYATIEKNTVAQESFQMQNFGEEFFSNGTLDDSEYDLIVDIQNIGNILFTSFIGPTETLFYRMPKNNTITTNALLKKIAETTGNESGNESKEGKDDELEESVNGTLNTGNEADQVQDSELEDFISGTKDTGNETKQNQEGKAEGTGTATTNTITTTRTNTTSKTNTISPVGIAQGNICLPSVSASNTEITTTTTEITTETIQEYLDNLDNKTNETIPIVDTTPESVLEPIPPQTDTQNEKEIQEEITTINQLVEAKINSIFDEESTQTCTNKCNDQTAAKKLACNNASLSTKEICDSQGIIDRALCHKERLATKATCLENIRSEEILCKIQCLCFSISYPRYGQKGLEGIDSQLKVRFCTIPVQQNRINKQSDILSRDDSLERIKLVFEKLLNGGEMIKYTKPKEYLDIQIAPIQRAKYISFEVKIYIKSLFSKNSKKEKEVKADNKLQESEQANKGESKAEVNWNRNSIIYDAALGRITDATTSKENIETNIAIERENEKLRKLNENISPNTAVQNSNNKKNIMFNEQMNTFLEENSKFWSDVKDQIEIFNKLSESTKQKLINLQ